MRSTRTKKRCPWLSGRIKRDRYEPLVDILRALDKEGDALARVHDALPADAAAEHDPVKPRSRRADCPLEPLYRDRVAARGYLVLGSS